MRRRVVRAVGASSFGSILAKVVSLASTLVLARLLTPEDFGLVAMATTVTGFIGFFNEMGIGAAIIQRTNLRKEELNGCFGIAILASACLSLLVAAISWPAAIFFEMPQLQMLLCVLGLGFMFGAINTVPTALLRKELRFQAVMWLGLVSAFIQTLTTIPLAYLGFGYWSIVCGFFIGQIVATIWYWRISTWRPSWPIQLREGKSLLGYGMNITFTRVLWHAYMNADKLIVGKLLSARAVGIYDVSRSLANLPTSQITGLVTGIASPVFARLQQDIPQLRAVQLRFTRGIAYLTFPVLGGMAVLAPELVAVLLGPKWADAVFPMQALCLSEAVASVTNLQSQVLISTGRASQLVRYNAICAVLIPLSLIIGGSLAGLPGIAIAWATVYPVISLWLWRDALRASEASGWQFWNAIRQPAQGTLIMILVIALIRPLFAPWLTLPLTLLLACVGVGTLVYCAYVIFLDKEGLREIRQVMSDLGLPPAVTGRWPFTRLDSPSQERA